MCSTVKEPTEDSPAIETFQLSKLYPHRVLAVNRLNLKIGRGVVHALVGPNGAGKTTTMQMLVGLSRPIRGSIFICGYDMLRESWEARQHIGFLPDSPSAYESLRVEEFLRFVASLYQIPEDVYEERRSRFVELFEIGSYTNKYMGALSRGMLQRSLLCGLLIRKPTVLVMDEPHYSLDPEGGYVLKQLFRDLAKEGHTILLSTHILSVAEEVSQEFTIISRGVKVAEGTVKDLRSHIEGGVTLEDYYISILRGREKADDS
ncbi:MAG: ABC transporter ATP-binding protein [Promethearchaeota archaeon]